MACWLFCRCRGLILLETYSTLDDARLQRKLPTFLTIEREVTGSADYSMYNLSLREDWKTSKKYLRTNFVGKCAPPVRWGMDQ